METRQCIPVVKYFRQQETIKLTPTLRSTAPVTISKI